MYKQDLSDDQRLDETAPKTAYL